MASRPKRGTAGSAAAKAATSRKSDSSTPPASTNPSVKITSPVRPTSRATTYTSPPVDITFAGPSHRFARADLLIEGIFHGEASYQGRIFLDNPDATADTPKTLAEGYAGSFNIFGHGGCVGDAGHCEITKRDPDDLRYPHPLTPATKQIKVTAALKAVATKKDTTTVTIVPVVTASTELCDDVKVFRCERMRFVSYDS